MAMGAQCARQIMGAAEYGAEVASYRFNRIARRHAF